MSEKVPGRNNNDIEPTIKSPEGHTEVKATWFNAYTQTILPPPQNDFGTNVYLADTNLSNLPIDLEAFSRSALSMEQIKAIQAKAHVFFKGSEPSTFMDPANISKIWEVARDRFTQSLLKIVAATLKERMGKVDLQRTAKYFNEANPDSLAKILLTIEKLKMVIENKEVQQLIIIYRQQMLAERNPTTSTRFRDFKMALKKLISGKLTQLWLTIGDPVVDVLLWNQFKDH
ncbi:MAG: hypothetical protein V4486_01330 [Patescibacteria group bacterium]